MENSELLSSITFVKTHVRYRALTHGYLSDWPARKIRAIVKGIVQSISPCLNQQNMDCTICSRKQECCYFNLMVEDQTKDFQPYVIGMPNEREWDGRIFPGSEHSFDCCLIGEKTQLTGNIVSGLKQKSLISLDDVPGRNVHFELCSVGIEKRGKPVGLEFLLARYAKKLKGGISKISQITIEFVSPVRPKFHSRIIQDPKQMDFEVFIDAVYKRLSGLAKDHCGYVTKEDHVDQYESLVPCNVSTVRQEDFRNVRKWAKKKNRMAPGMRKISADCKAMSLLREI